VEYSIFDFVFAASLLIAAVSGYMKGLVRQLIGLLGIIAGTYCAWKIATALTGWWQGHFNVDPKITRAIIFVILAIIIYVLVVWLAKLLDKLIKMAMLAWINRLLGMLFGVLKIVLIFGILAYAAQALRLTAIETIGNDLSKSVGYELLQSVIKFVFPYIAKY
jgi:membrane protein required for colicin V production